MKGTDCCCAAPAEALNLPQSERGEVRERAQLLITNPDMLHQSILPLHSTFARLLGNLRYVVVDEGHAYRCVWCSSGLCGRQASVVSGRPLARSGNGPSLARVAGRRVGRASRSRPWGDGPGMTSCHQVSLRSAESHTWGCRGVFGCHTALVLRRLRRICARQYQRLPTFLVTSATIGNPAGHAAELIGALACSGHH